MATITALAGVTISPERPLDGVNLIPYLTGGQAGPPHDQLFWRKWEQQGMAIRAGAAKLVSDDQRQTHNYRLFDLTTDTRETNDRLPASPESAKLLLEQWEAWNAQLRDRIFPTLMNDTWWERQTPQ